MASDALGKLILTLLRGVAWAYALQPLWLRRAWGGLLGTLLYGARFKSAVVDENLAIAFPERTIEARDLRERLFRDAYSHLGHLVFEVTQVLGPLRLYVRRNAIVHGYENWKKAHDLGKGVIYLSSHVGNWEIMAASGGLLDMNLMLVTKHLKPEWLHQAIESGRAKCGVLGTYEPRTMRDVLSHLKKNGTVGFVLDQYTGPPVGVRVPFFGVPVGTHMVVAILAKRTGAPVVPVVNYRTRSGRYRIEIQPALEWRTAGSATEELAANTAHYAEVLESHVRAHPEQWLWIHRRFKGDLSPLREGEWLEGRTRA